MAVDLETNHQHRRRRFTMLYWLAAFLVLLLAQQWLADTSTPREVDYSELLATVRQGEVERVKLTTTEVVAELKPAGDAEAGEVIRAERLPDVEPTALLEAIEAQGVALAGEIDTPSWWQPLLFGWLVPIGLLALLYFYGMRRLSRGAGGAAMTFGKSRVKIYDRNLDQRITFSDVAGVDEAKDELREIIDFLDKPERYRELGARIPKGVLLVGPPGTGKTLLARAVAGQANVPFFSLSGSDFVEMFVGVGASRMRDLFEQGKTKAPCIIFIDELDAIGKSRGGVGAMATHDEREQTLNQLLVELDGFDPSQGVVIMAATNRPEVLDPALLRAGRFDRQIVVDRPDLRGRREILEVHARKLRLAGDVDLQVIARRTPGMVGADLANVVNEAALAAARRRSATVEMVDFDTAIDRIQLGQEKRSRVMGDEEKRRVAYHESGHALVALSVERADPVHRVTIIPRSIGALGATLQLPTQDRYLVTRPELTDRIAVMLGGRAAEDLILGDLSTGAENDLERATETARAMVCRFGMSARLGPVTFGQPAGSRFLDLPVSLGDHRNYSEETAQAIDEEVRSILDQEYGRCRAILERRHDALVALAERLLVDETLDGEEVRRLVDETAGAPVRSPRGGDGARAEHH